jgi:asparagine synthase (glutamine-hydrolysing)
MCGICGVVSLQDQVPELSLIQSMTRTMRHRGPDDEGYETLPGVGFGFQRLSIIDLSGGHQPMSTPDGSLHLVFNGEIYNFQTLRKNLEDTGRHTFRTRSDTEVILHLYQEYGTHCVDYLRGMFAFAIWDSQKKRLFMARDRFGKKPLVYAERPGMILFASELRALLKHPAISKEIDYPSIDLYLTYQYIPSPSTIFKQIRKLPPAHWMIWEKGQSHSERYWEPPFAIKTQMSQKEAGEAMMQELREATRLRMIADVPLGAFLSGGKDSSIVVGLMSELSSRPVKTFSIGFEEGDFSELPFARKVADRFKCDHHEFMVKPNAVDILPKLAWHYGEPYADSSALPSYYVSQMTRQHVTVALNGDGGDETMGGYPRYQAMKFMKLWSWMPLSLRKQLTTLSNALPANPATHSLSSRLRRLMRIGACDEQTMYLDTICFFREHQKVGLYSDFMRDQLKSFNAPDYILEILSRAKKLHGIDPYLYTDLTSYLPECLMVKMDIASMANSLETRSPFLDHKFVELVGSFPDTWKLKGLTQTKYLLTEKVRGWLPNDILDRPKQGFSLPMAHWFRGPLKKYVRDILLSDLAKSRNIFNPQKIEHLVSDNETGRANYSYQIWALLMLEHWYQAYVDPSPL